MPIRITRYNKWQRRYRLRRRLQLWTKWFVLNVCAFVALIQSQLNAFSDELNEPHNKNVAENRLSTQIFALIEHYKQVDPVGLPGAPVPDPFTVPDVSKSIGMGTLKMKNTLAYGLSKFRINSLSFDVNQLKVFVVL